MEAYQTRVNPAASCLIESGLPVEIRLASRHSLHFNQFCQYILLSLYYHIDQNAPELYVVPIPICRRLWLNNDLTGVSQCKPLNASQDCQVLGVDLMNEGGGIELLQNSGLPVRILFGGHFEHIHQFYTNAYESKIWHIIMFRFESCALTREGRAFGRKFGVY